MPPAKHKYINSFENNPATIPVNKNSLKKEKLYPVVIVKINNGRKDIKFILLSLDDDIEDFHLSFFNTKRSRQE